MATIIIVLNMKLHFGEISEIFNIPKEDNSPKFPQSQTNLILP